jgi:hypothetical protein
MRQSPSKDPLHSEKLHVSSNSKSHPVKLGTLLVADLGPKVAPVHVGVTGLFLNSSSVCKRARDDVATGLLSNKGNVPLKRVSRQSMYAWAANN